MQHEKSTTWNSDTNSQTEEHYKVLCQHSATFNIGTKNSAVLNSATITIAITTNATTTSAIWKSRTLK